MNSSTTLANNSVHSALACSDTTEDNKQVLTLALSDMPRMQLALVGGGGVNVGLDY